MLRLWQAAACVALVVSGCQQGAAAPTSSPVGPTPSQAAVPTVAAPTVAPTTGPTLPVTVPRPRDLPTDGSCEEEDATCLGLLTPGKTYATQIWKPTLSFSVPSADWMNRFDGGGDFGLLPISTPGDAIMFFREPRAEDKAVGTTVADIAAWLEGYDQVTVTPPKPVKIGGLSGVTLDLRNAPGATGTDTDCPVRVCVPLLRGDDPVRNDPYPWHWRWGIAGTERQRLYLLTFEDGAIAIIVDSLDGLTFDSLTRAFDQIAPTIKFG